MSSVPAGLTIVGSSRARRMVQSGADERPRPDKGGAPESQAGRSEPVPTKRLHEVRLSGEAVIYDLIERTYAAAEEPRLWTDFLERLARSLRGTVTVMVCEDFRAGYPSLMAGTRLDGVLSLAYKEYFSSDDARPGNERSEIAFWRSSDQPDDALLP